MKHLALKPVIDRPSTWERLETVVIRLFRTEIYLPLLRELKVNAALLNSLSTLRERILSGSIRYTAGAFRGEFTASVSKELRDLGAVWTGNAWRISLDKLADTVVSAITEAIQRDAALKAKLVEKLEALAKKDAGDAFVAKSLFKFVEKVTEADLHASLRPLALTPRLSRQAKDKLADEYTTNIKKYIKGWTEEETTRLREYVETHVFEGNRIDELAKHIRKSYQVSERKAKFLARQETKLLTTKLKEAQYAEVGIDEYKWHSVTGTAAHPVRPMHKELNDRSARGEVFRFSSPPVTDPDGRHNNPGEDYNCRCVAIPIVSFERLNKRSGTSQ